MDVIIIGSGPAGLSAAIYAARANLSFSVIERLYPGGKLVWIEKIENYPGFPGGISGAELAERFYSQALKLGVNLIFEDVLRIEKSGEKFNISTKDKTYETKNVVVASGSIPKHLGIKGEDTFKGKGVSYCALCDGAFFRNKEVVVIGEGKQVEADINFLRNFSSVIWIRHPGKMYTSIDGINIIEGKPVEITGENRVEKVLVQTKSGITEIKADGVFIFAGFKPSFEFLPPDVNLDNAGYIITDKNFLTSVNGMYACGDIRSGSMKQIVSAVYEAAAVINHIRKHL
ncbi:MAG TPA: FAD-dependent oxidoreductase [Candidatus Ratteibacteria bacterium]|jgi:thioredoxin reductase (NADPH)|uniref:Thioredoxin reductase n=1 Tax=candidate division TA06 bacterium ADurb.Bin131 TaxID=1852827 RepID=A0A1V6C8N2_UNCT6|nr:MAG: Thioredoxin reductase [candidate division TA06 bacterium ADurb.Bin131]HOC02100.1 FAD-dependent oxidoreductase [bacterium]HRS06415.1 FAD-dependent oxidoreductase [Candidatus Ratteibacteria bacterium]HRV04652.1 FAD-dependent oxidoreductase [Candidatus Ratteibacteria bacterium]